VQQWVQSDFFCFSLARAIFFSPAVCVSIFSLNGSNQRQLKSTGIAAP
jgi:hypothetical protein